MLSVERPVTVVNKLFWSSVRRMSSSSSVFTVRSPHVQYSPEEITALYHYQSTSVIGHEIIPVEENLLFKTQRKVPKLGLMLVGWGGNNGTTVTAGVLANKHKISWYTKDGLRQPDYFGSLTQASTIKIGLDVVGEPVFIPFSDLLPMVHPNDIVLGGWDISSLNLADAMVRAKVIDYDLQQKLYPHMAQMKPLPSAYFEDFIAANQGERADNVLSGSKQQQMETIRQNIKDFKATNALDKVIVLWTATTERYSDIISGVNDTADNLLGAIKVRPAFINNT